MDGIDRLECVYYSGPIPSDRAVLTTLCFLFDKIYFPGVHLPKGDFDRDLLQKEIARLEALDNNTFETNRLISAMKFLNFRITLDGILEYPSSDSIFGRSNDVEQGKLARTIYDVNFPPKENFEPIITTAQSKALPGSNESIDYLEDFYYQAGAIKYAESNNIPLIDDGSLWALPFKAQYKDNAQSLATLLAIESVGLVLPELPILTPQEIVDFRMENVKELRNFRASMLRCAKSLNVQISDDTSSEELQRKIKFVIDTEIVPSLHELNRDLINPNRPWHRRIVDGVRIASSVAIGVVTGGLAGTTAAEGVKSVVLSEFEGSGDKLQTVKRNGLYYLLRAQGVVR